MTISPMLFFPFGAVVVRALFIRVLPCSQLITDPLKTSSPDLDYSSSVAMSDNYSDDQDGLSTSSPTSIEFGDIEEKLTNVVEFSQQRISKRHRVNRSTGESSRISERINESLKNGHSSTLEEKFLDRNITAVFLQSK
jgi:hypothetical protein